MENIVILGSGPAGYTAALYAARAGLAPLVITGNCPGGLPTQLSTVENYPGFPEPKNAFELSEAMREQAERFGARLHYGFATRLRLQPDGPHTVTLDDDTEITCRTLVVAVGSKHVELGLKSEKALRNRGVSYCAVCDGALSKGKTVAVAGGSGDTPLIEALYLARFAAEVHLITKTETLAGTPSLCRQITETPAIHLHLHAEIAEIHDIKAGKVTSVTIRNKSDAALSEIPCSALFIAVGQAPNTALFDGQLPLDPRGYILLPDPRNTRTAVPGVFAAGDCADPVYKQIITAAASGCKAALDALAWLREHPEP